MYIKARFAIQFDEQLKNIDPKIVETLLDKHGAPVIQKVADWASEIVTQTVKDIVEKDKIKDYIVWDISSEPNSEITPFSS
jgi:hypothetical protein